MENLDYKYRRAISRVSKMFWYLDLSLADVYPKSYSCKSSRINEKKWYSSFIYTVEYDNNPLLVLEYGDCIKLIDEEGIIVKEIRLKIPEMKRISFLTKMAINSKNIVMVINERIEVFDYEGNNVRTIGYQMLITNIAVSDNMIMVVERNRVLAFDYNGKILFSIDDAQYIPCTVAINDMTQEILVSERNTNRINVYNKEGEYLRMISWNMRNKDVYLPPNMVISNNMIIIFTLYHNDIQIMDRKGKLIYELNFKERTKESLTYVSVLKDGTIVCKSSDGIYFFEPNY